MASLEGLFPHTPGEGGKDQPDGNATLIGWFVSIPQICKDLHCYDKSKSSVVDKGRPIKLSNLTFTWRSPPTDYGAIKFVASIVVGQEYHVIESSQISFNNFPVSIRGCGREMSCFRSCSTSPTCDPEDSDTMAVMYLTGDKRNVVVSLGGVVQDENVSTEVCNKNFSYKDFSNIHMFLLIEIHCHGLR